MLKILSTFINDCLTGKDGESYDVARVGILFGTVVLCGGAVYGLIHMPPKSTLTEVGNLLENLGMGLATLIGGGSAGIGLKSKTEPE